MRIKASKTTEGKEYMNRLVSLEYQPWKTRFDVQRPYRWNIHRLRPGRTLDIGCGIGRYLKYLPAGSVGIDHNAHAIRLVRQKGLPAYTTRAFEKSIHGAPGYFDSLLLSHVLEHMMPKEGIELLRHYTPYLRRGGRVIICCPQEKGYTTDETHKTFLDNAALSHMLKQAGYTVIDSYSFPFPRFTGKFFAYNEFVVLGQKK